MHSDQLCSSPHPALTAPHCQKKKKKTETSPLSLSLSTWSTTEKGTMEPTGPLFSHPSLSLSLSLSLYMVHNRERNNGAHRATLFQTMHSNPFKSKALPACSVPSSFDSNLSLSQFLLLSHSFVLLDLALPPLMKTPPSSPFDLNSGAAAGCLSGIVRRLPCACSLRNNAPGDSSESEGSGGSLGLEWKNSAMQKKPPATPSIVARLMGLDSMPVFPYTPPESAKRNRSSSSLREAPTYLRQENEKFLILTFAPEDEAESVVVSGGKGKVKVGDLKERTKEIGSTERRVAERKTRNKHKNSPKKNSTGRKHSNGRITKLDSNVKPMKLEEMPITSEGANSTKKKLSAAQRKTKAGYSTQETSPVSVLDYTSVDGEYCISLNSPDSEEELLPPPPQSSRKKLSSKFESFNSTPSNFHLQTISRGREMIFLDEPCMKSSNAEPVIPDRSRVWKKICILTEEDMKKNSTWMSREVLMSEEVCEIAAVVALKVLDLLLEEAVSEIFNST